ncbi:putative Rho GTPase-activating protein 22/24/25 [Monocercomonoides exilis]|uniref:putative Rho GTPase-activating protein 22/24/25 n=1 Tax=Monocercomonoides exilis TaxID=2049356 RepID=UPI00355A8BA5|nr:putative Rho GTPase-activating protein 22/24/25 [Monocercomonoides exilis]|eukprot:MONOS_7232.1-p1 / transcript=MONOS_7232.1 / gene=MONOS_7232 / organism=Monocercomonoides_exilis_PA203 / gene_product=unspecified product / transcript_product=unspecified product / location=Mono_scaffold00242:33469-34224(-) / protein_length=169 / sequence_SO=supercontig / SO=protein_coding / is_pseudo=false
MSRPRLQAQFDFTARVANELTFKEGDIITLIEKHESGMWKGELDGKIGLFPYNFVAEMPSEEESAPKGPPKPMEGWLTKQGHFMKNWKRRWFSLRGSTLYYYEKPTSTKESGSIPLSGCQVTNAEEKSDKPFCFHISYPHSTGQKEYFICAEDVNQMNAWVGAIVEAAK